MNNHVPPNQCKPDRAAVLARIDGLISEFIDQQKEADEHDKQVINFKLAAGIARLKGGRALMCARDQWKAQMGHGGWLDHLDARLGGQKCRRTGYNYIELAEHVRDMPDLLSDVGKMGFVEFLEHGRAERLRRRTEDQNLNAADEKVILHGIGRFPAFWIRLTQAGQWDQYKVLTGLNDVDADVMRRLAQNWDKQVDNLPKPALLRSAAEEDGVTPDERRPKANLQ
jgi:hypothetical protein